MRKMMTSLVYIFVLFLVIVSSEAQLSVGFYANKCPQAESVVQRVIRKEVTSDPQKAAILLRLHFHDCFVEGCDGSILLKHDGDESSASGNAGVNGFSTIREVKSELERVCPGVVSCSDIVALAARDAVFLAHGPFYEIPTGRRDGLVSKAENARNLPEPQESMDSLRSKFIDHGLSDRDLVLLTAGAHTIGRTACFFVTPRLNARDADINSDFFRILRSRCPESGDAAVKIPLDWNSEFRFDTHIFANIKSGRAVIASDSVLYRHDSTKKIIDGYLSNSSSFATDFSRAMVKMGLLGVKTGDEGQIRRVCNVTN